MNKSMTRVLIALYEGATLTDTPSAEYPIALKRSEDDLNNTTRRKTVESLMGAKMIQREPLPGGWRYHLTAHGRNEAAKIVAQQQRGKRR